MELRPPVLGFCLSVSLLSYLLYDIINIILYF